MKIAVFDHVGNWGGGSRFIRALLLALRTEHPETQLTFFGNKRSLQREDIESDFIQSGIEVSYLSSVKTYQNKYIDYLSNEFSKALCKMRVLSPERHANKLREEIESLAEVYDLAFFPWPYFIECPNLKCPMVGVFHDFNHRYFFGDSTFSEQQHALLNNQIGDWLTRSNPVVSSNFIASELMKFYPNYRNKLKTIHMAPFSISNIQKVEAMKIVKDFGIDAPYLLYPTNLCRHKNIGILFRALFLLRKKGISLKLVVTGPRTESVTGRVADHGIERDVDSPDVIGLGYVSNEQIDALIQCARMVISTSLYEAGNGPGLEAWSRGVPVAMSDIPSFTEHIEVLGVKALVFDPYDANDIAEKVYGALSNYEHTKKDAEVSRDKLQEHSWGKVANEYHQLFSALAVKT